MTVADLGTSGDACARVLIVADRGSFSADFPGARQLARDAGLPVLEPADADEAAVMIDAGGALAEEFACTVLIHLSGDGSMLWGPRQAQSTTAPLAASGAPPGLPRSFQPAALPAIAPGGDALRQARSRELANWADRSQFNVLERGRGTPADRRFGFIAAGPACRRIRAVYPHAPLLRIGTPYPLPLKHARGITEMCRAVLVVEHGEPYIENELRAEGFRVHGVGLLSRTGGIGSAALTEALEALAAAAR